MDLNKQAHQHIDVETKRKILAHRRIKGLLFTLNALFIIYGLFYGGYNLFMWVDDNIIHAELTQSTINLCGNGSYASRMIYDSYFQQDYKVVNDYSIYGERLFLSEYSLANSATTFNGEFVLYNVCRGKEYSFDVEEGIDLRVLDLGDYIVHLKENGVEVSLMSPLNANATIDLLPKSDMRLKSSFVNVKGNKNIVIKINKTTDLDKNRADVFFDLQIPFYDPTYRLKELNPQIKIGINNLNLSVEDRINTILGSGARYSLVIKSGDDYLVEEDSLVDLDQFPYPHVKNKVDPLIKQTGAVHTGAFSCQEDVPFSCAAMQYATSLEKIGTQTIIVYIPTSEIKEVISAELLLFIDHLLGCFVLN